MTSGSPLYGRVLLGAVLDDVRAGGVTHEVLAAGSGDDPVGTVLGLRLMAAVHRIVLEGRAPNLAAYYPSAGGTTVGDAGLTFVAAVAAHRAELLVRIHDGLQTNEVGRSAALIGGYADVAARTGLPLRVLEAGASAGLNLRWDHFAYDLGRRVAGDPASTVRFPADVWVGKPPDLPSEILVVSRRGCDRNPLDPTDPDDRLRLRSALWPDQPHRAAVMDAALTIAARVPVAVDRSGAAAWVDAQLAAPAPGRATVVVHSIVLQYLDPAERMTFLDTVAAAGARATAEAPLAWLRMEPAGAHAEVRCTTWTGGEPHDELLARSGFHGRPVRWRPPQVSIG